MSFCSFVTFYHVGNGALGSINSFCCLTITIIYCHNFACFWIYLSNFFSFCFWSFNELKFINFLILISPLKIIMSFSFMLTTLNYFFYEAISLSCSLTYTTINIKLFSFKRVLNDFSFSCWFSQSSCYSMLSIF